MPQKLTPGGKGVTYYVPGPRIPVNRYPVLKRAIPIRIRRILKAKGLTQAQLAHLMGVSRPFITTVLSGKTNLTLETIAKLSYALGEPLITVLP